MHRKGLAFFLALIIMITGNCSIKASDNTGLVNLRQLIPDALIELPYATADNFVGQVLYSANEAYLVEPAAKALASVAADLREQGFRVKILDAYRPLAVQSILWKIKPDPSFVAPPTSGSRHNRGASVDITLVDADLKEIEMPSKYDEFGPKARSYGQKLPASIQKNLETLQNAMKKYGFTTINSEWWHFDFQDWKKFRLLNVSFENLR
ncbi:MAG: M15 family metallopeptidase [Candidatus Rifleibacteriota bacterium]